MHRSVSKGPLTGPSVPPISSSYNPADDFYMYVNAIWQHKTVIPSYAHTIGVSEEIEESLKDTLLEALTKRHKKHPSAPISLASHGFLTEKGGKHSVQFLKDVMTSFDDWKTIEDVGDAIGFLNRIQSRAPLSVVISSDSNDSDQCCVFLYEPELGLPEKHVYNAMEHHPALTAYKKMLNESGKALGFPGFESAAKFEADLLPHMSAVEDRKDVRFSYDPQPFKAIQSLFPGIPWTSIFSGMRLPLEVAEDSQFIVTNKQYFSHLEGLFKRLSMDDWRIWMRTELLGTFLEYLPAPFKDYHYVIYDHILRGSTKPHPADHIMLRALQKFAPQALSQVYVEEAVPKATKPTVIKLIGQLKAATKARIALLGWMSPESRVKATDKIEAMRFQVGYPDDWDSELKHIRVKKDEPLQCLFDLASSDTIEMIHDLKEHACGKDVDVWEEGAFEVNAYYYPEGNMMTIPAGILNPPFFDLHRSNAWNLGGIGAAIGHEITHGFDEDGRNYDAEGNYNPWLSAEDSHKFTRLAQTTVALYQKQHIHGGVVNGRRTLSENLADLGGLSIALEALRHLLVGSKVEDQMKAYREFFESYAVSWRTKQRPEKAKQALLLDRHAPAQLRVNLVVRQFQEFYDAYDIKEGSAGYVPVSERIVFW